MDLEDRLELKITEGRNLGEAPGGLDPNPYCIVHVGEFHEQSNIVPRTANPKWGKSAMSMIFQDIVDNDIEFAVIDVLHKDLSGGEDLQLGRVKVPFAGVFASPKIATLEWYPVQPVAQMRSKVPQNASLQVEMTYFIGDEAIPNPDDFIDDEKEVKAPNMLVVTISRARNLKLPKGKTSMESYVSMSVAGQKHSTATVPGTSPKARSRMRTRVAREHVRACSTRVLAECTSI